MQRQDVVWQRADLVDSFVHEIRGGVPFGIEQIEMMLRVLSSRGAPRRFIDLGCGSGVLASALLGRFPQARGLLVDFSEPMLAEARRNLAPHAERVTYMMADLAEPLGEGLRDAPFDAVVSSYAIHHLADTRKRALYAEIFERLAPGGIFLNVEHVASRSPWIETISDELFVDSIYSFQARQGRDKSREQVESEFVDRPDKAANILAPVEDQCAWLREIGFADVDCYFKVFELAVFGGRRPPTSSVHPR